MNIVNKSLTTSSLSSPNYDFLKSKVQFINSPQHFRGQHSLIVRMPFHRSIYISLGYWMPPQSPHHKLYFMRILCSLRIKVLERKSWHYFILSELGISFESDALHFQSFLWALCKEEGLWRQRDKLCIEGGRQKAKSPSWLSSISSTWTQSVWQERDVIWYECHQPHTFL